MTQPVSIAELMAQSGVAFGTSGARGLVSAMTDRICFAYTCGFLQYLEDIGQFAPGSHVAVAGDLRPSSPRIMNACAAALDGSIETLMEWKSVQPGSFYYIPAGTVHAIGGGVVLVEIQQNNDVTYRLYDYGRPRELHLAQGVAVAVAEPYGLPDRVIAVTAEERLIGSGAPFTLDIIQGQAHTCREIKSELLWFIPLAGTGTLSGESWRPGECWLIEGEATIEVAEPMSALIAQPVSSGRGTD